MPVDLHAPFSRWYGTDLASSHEFSSYAANLKTRAMLDSKTSNAIQY